MGLKGFIVAIAPSAPFSGGYVLVVHFRTACAAFLH